MIKEDCFDPLEGEDPWRLYFPGDPAAPFDSTLMQSIRALSSTDQRSASSGLEMLLKHAANGRPLEEVYNKKTCHEAFSFVYRDASYKVWRIRKNDVRIYFYYLNGRVILLSRVGAKREDKLTAGERTEIEQAIKTVLDAEDSVQFKECKK